MSDAPSCSYCTEPCDKRGGCFVVERYQGGHVVARGGVCSVGCLIATAHAQRPRADYEGPVRKGRLEQTGAPRGAEE